MTRRATMIFNTASGSFDPDLGDRLIGIFQQGGVSIDRVIRCPDEELPDIASLASGGSSMVAVFAGDGTINAMASRLAGWDGVLLALPGGTMNLLSKALHGDASPEAIAARAVGGDTRAVRMPVIAGAGEEALVGVIAGPTTAWGEVRESLRAMDVTKLASAVPNALGQTFSGPMVRLEGGERDYPALFLEATAQGIQVHGFTADGIGELLSHGMAWLAGDFRDGPHDDLGLVRALTIVSDQPDIGLLIDGEQCRSAGPVRFEAALSGVRFLATGGTATSGGTA